MTNKKSVAVYLVVLLLASPFASTVALGDTVSGGVANVSQVGNAPAVLVPDATVEQDGGDIEVAYDVTGEVAPEDVTIRLSGPFDAPLEKNGVPSEKGKVVFSLPARDAPGGYRIRADLIDESATDWSERFPADDSAAISVQSSVTVTDFAIANTASGNDELLDGETFTLDVTVNNEAEDEQDVSLNAYVDSGARPNGQKTVSVAGNAETTVSLPVEAPGYDLPDGMQIDTSVAVNALDGQDTIMKGVPTVDASATDITVDWPDDLYPGDTVPITATIKNDESTYGKQTVTMMIDGESVGQPKTVYLPADGSDTVTFYPTFESAGEHTVAVAGAEKTVTVSEPVAEVVSVEHVGGTEPGPTDGEIATEHTMITPPSDDGGLLQVDIWNGGSEHPQDIGGLGIDETTRFEITIEIDESYAPDVLVATAQDASWTVTEVSGGYEVTVEARPLGAQYISPSPESGSWPTGDADRATTSFDPMFSLAFADLPDGNAAQDISGTIIATDAQRFGTPTYYTPGPDEEPVLELSVAGPHYTVGGDVNQGRYEAFLPDSLLDTWGVSEPDDLEGAYQDESLELNVEEVDGGMKVSVPIHYSSGTVQLSRASESDSPGDGYSPPSNPAPPSSTETTTKTTTQGTTTVAETTTEETTEVATETTEDVPSTTTSSADTTQMAYTTESTETTATEDASVPGFGVAASLVALAAAALLASRRGR